MTLLSTLQISNNALIASQLGLQVVGNNIANANTPGYIRQQVVLTPAPTQRYGGLLLGLGVEVQAVIQQTDRFLEDRLRSAESDLASGEAQEKTYVQLESLLGELSDTDLSTALTEFFGSVQDILNQPDSESVRNLAVLQGQSLASDISRLHERVGKLRQDINVQIDQTAVEINGHINEIAKLNVQILQAEGGGTSASDAVGLRDRRSIVLKELSKILDITAIEQPTGDVSVFVGGDYIVFQGTPRPVTIEQTTDRGQTISKIKLIETDAPLFTSSGKLAGLVTSRDAILGGFLDNLDDFASTLISEFNKVYSQGQGLSGYSEVSAEFAVDNTQASLDAAGLKFTPGSGSFELLVLNKQTGLTTTSQISVDLNGLDEDTSLEDLVAAIDAVDGIEASIDPNRRLEIKSDSLLVEFSFGGDTSGVLAALGINTFFKGSKASDIGVNSDVKEDPGLFAASRNGIGEDTEIAVKLANLLTTPLASQNGTSLAVLYDRFTAEVSQGASVTNSVTEGYRVFQQTLEGQLLAITGVNLDEEAVRMIQYQRSFQASARVISTINDLLEVLVNL